MPNSPFQPGATTCSAEPSKTVRSGLITETLSASAMSDRQSQRLARFDHVVNAALHIECLFREVVELTADHTLERLDGLLELHVLAFVTGELLGHVEGLGEESLNAAGTTDQDLVVFGQFIHAQNRDD